MFCQNPKPATPLSPANVRSRERFSISDAKGASGVAVENRDDAGMIHANFGMVPAVADAMNAQRQVWAAFKRAFA